jgi:uncharacterized protein (TIGR02145 family)
MSLLKKIFNKKSLSQGLVLASAPFLLSYCASDNKRDRSTTEPTQETEYIEEKSGKTDSEGKVYFTDNSTLERVVIEVTDAHGSPIPEVGVNFIDGEGYEVFWLRDSSNNYLPTLGIYSHNSTHTIEMSSSEEGIHEIYILDENNPLGDVVWKWRDSEGIGFSTYGYERTINYEEYLGIQERGSEVLDLLWNGVEYFLGISSPKKPSEIVEYLFPEQENPPQRWDLYNYWDGQNKSFTLIPSNIPTIQINNLEVDGSDVYASWEGTDEDAYEQFVFLPDNKDLTIYVDGNSTSDLKYSYRITQEEVVYGNNWTEYNSEKSANINVEKKGDYTLELRVKDEVDNIGEASENFSIVLGEDGENFEKGILYESRGEKDTYKIIKISTQWWMAENLKYKYIPHNYYNNDHTNYSKYGLLYGGNKIPFACSSGWHVPSLDEWKSLAINLGFSPETSGNVTASIEEINKLFIEGGSGLDIPTGGCKKNTYFIGEGSKACYWLSSEGDFGGQLYLEFTKNSNKIRVYEDSIINNSFSVRCIKDK